MGTPCSLWSIWHRHTGVAWHAVVAQCVPWVRVHSLNWMCALYKHIPYFGFTFSTSLLYCIGALDWLMKSVHIIFAVAWQLGPMMTRSVDRFFFRKKKNKIGTRKPEPEITQPQISCSCSVFPLRLCNVYSPFNALLSSKGDAAIYVAHMTLGLLSVLNWRALHKKVQRIGEELWMV